MISSGMNPHGLEDVTLTFHVLDQQSDGTWAEINTYTSKNRLYCWARFPKEARDAWGDAWTVECIEDGENIETRYDELPKYYSYKMEDPEYVTMYVESENRYYYVTEDEDGDYVASSPVQEGVAPPVGAIHCSSYWGTAGDAERPLFMVRGKQDFYVQIFHVFSFGIPEYATVYILDTSGSMGGGDNNSNNYRKSTHAITQTLMEYFCMENCDARIFMYAGTYANNITAQDLGTLPERLENAITSEDTEAIDKIATDVNTLVDKVKKKGGSESMLTCMYYAIGDIYDKLIKGQIGDDVSAEYGGTYANIGGSYLRGITFFLLTDEPIWKSDTFYNVDTVINKNDWLKSWQQSSAPGHKKLPTSYPTANNPINGAGLRPNKIFVSQDLNDALTQMSYFYGININWGISYNLINSNDKFDLMPKEPNPPTVQYKPGNVIPGNTDGNVNTIRVVYDYGSDNYEYGKGHDPDYMYGYWVVPDKIPYPYQFMITVKLKIPEEYNIILKETSRMRPGDLLTSTDNIRQRWHYKGIQGGYRVYIAFRHWGNPCKIETPESTPENIKYYDWDTVVLPNVSCIQTVGAGDIGEGQYTWDYKEYDDYGQETTESITIGSSTILQLLDSGTYMKNYVKEFVMKPALVQKTDTIVFRIVNKYDTGVSPVATCGCGLDVYLNGVQVVSHIDSDWRTCEEEEVDGYRSIKFDENGFVQGVESSLGNERWMMSWNQPRSVGWIVDERASPPLPYTDGILVQSTPSNNYRIQTEYNAGIGTWPVVPTVYYSSVANGEKMPIQNEITVGFSGDNIISITADGATVVGGTYTKTVIEKIHGIAYTHPGDIVFKITYYE